MVSSWPLKFLFLSRAAAIKHLGSFALDDVCLAATRGGAHPPLAVSYPFIAMAGSSVSTQAAELTKRFSGGRAELFPATFLETIVITQLGRDSREKNKRKKPWEEPRWRSKDPLRASASQLLVSQACYLSVVELRVRKTKKCFGACGGQRVQIRTTGTAESVAPLQPQSSPVFLTAAGSK